MTDRTQDDPPDAPPTDYFVVIPTGVLSLGPYATAVYGVLRDFADMRSHECWPSHKSIAVKAGLSERKVQSVLRELRDHGWVTWTQRKGGNGTLTSNVYRLYGSRARHEVHQVVHEVHQGASAQGAPGGARDAEELIPNELEPKNKEPMVTADAATEQPFDAFWANYPRKVGKQQQGSHGHKPSSAHRHPSSSLAAAKWQPTPTCQPTRRSSHTPPHGSTVTAGKTNPTHNRSQTRRPPNTHTADLRPQPTPTRQPHPHARQRATTTQRRNRMSLPTITATGNLTADPELRFTQAGKAVATVSIATNRSRKTDAGWETTHTTYLTVKLWEADAETAAEHLHKGERVMISGELLIEEWEDKNGNKRQTPTIDRATIAKALPRAARTTPAQPWDDTQAPF